MLFYNKLILSAAALRRCNHICISRNLNALHRGNALKSAFCLALLVQFANFVRYRFCPLKVDGTSIAFVLHTTNSSVKHRVHVLKIILSLVLFLLGNFFAVEESCGKRKRARMSRLFVRLQSIDY